MRCSRFRRPALWLGALLSTLLITIGCATLDEQQRRWIFQPAKQTWWAGPDALAGTEEVWIDFPSKVTGRPARLHGAWLPHDDPRAPALLYLHGARWDLGGSARRMQRWRDKGFSVLGIDYRGFGRSQDELPSEQMAYEDARAGWAWLAAHAPDRPRYVFGHSLGAAIAVDLASEVDDVRGLIVEGAFTSVPDVVASQRWGWLPVGVLITQRFDAEDRMSRVRVPVLVVHGSEDRLIPPALGRRLYDSATTPKRFVLVDGGSHHNAGAVGQSMYREALRELFGL